VTPYRFLMRLKMSHAASLLLNPDALVKEVAYELDFSDPFHFSRSFKSVYGVSPERFMNRGARR
jgi:AraC-like DNA-binding protein